jgi:hypothetical protein
VSAQVALQRLGKFRLERACVTRGRATPAPGYSLLPMRTRYSLLPMRTRYSLIAVDYYSVLSTLHSCQVLADAAQAPQTSTVMAAFIPRGYGMGAGLLHVDMIVNKTEGHCSPVCIAMALHRRLNLG